MLFGSAFASKQKNIQRHIFRFLSDLDKLQPKFRSEGREGPVAKAALLRIFELSSYTFELINAATETDLREAIEDENEGCRLGAERLEDTKQSKLVLRSNRLAACFKPLRDLLDGKSSTA